MPVVDEAVVDDKFMDTMKLVPKELASANAAVAAFGLMLRPAEEKRRNPDCLASEKLEVRWEVDTSAKISASRTAETRDTFKTDQCDKPLRP